MERDRKARLFRVANHDLRGPVANVRSYISLLKSQAKELPPRAQRSAEVIERNADRALALLGEFFDFMQAREGCLELAIEPTEVRPLIEGAVKAASALSAEAGVCVEADIPELPPALVEGNALGHALAVLVERAIGRCPHGGKVRVAAHRGEGGLEISVLDSGPAPSEDEIQGLCDPDGWLDREGKLSLGFRVAVAAEEIRTMGGDLSAQTGTSEVVLRLPLASA